MSTATSQKTYNDRSIQTEPIWNPPCTDDPAASKVHDAYISPVSDPSLKNCDTSHSKPSQLGFQKPSGKSFLSKRVVSLPETSPQRVAVSKERVVSLSERPKPPSFFPDTSLSSDRSECSSSPGIAQSSLDTPITKRSRSQFRSSLSSLGFLSPRTPSPPSSPESVMIIGSDMQVPSSFHRHGVVCESKTRDGMVFPSPSSILHPKTSLVEWNTWTNSPPRPIPALHGPLSLPYARCPSGAEGTIIEGEDLGRMIWGLDNDEAQRARVLNTFPESQSIPEHDIIASSTTKTSGQLQAKSHSSSRSPIILPRRLSNTHVNNFRPPRLRRDDLPIILNGSSDSWCIGEPLTAGRFFDGTVPDGHPKGLGIFRHKSTVSSRSYAAERDCDQAQQLKASAPVFIPSRQLAEHCQSEEYLDRPSPAPSTRMKSAFDLAQEYYVHNESLPTPPSSSSTLWTPSLPTPLLLDSPEFVEHDEESEQLQKFVYERLKQSDYNLVSDVALSLSMDKPMHHPFAQISDSLPPPASPTFNVDVHRSNHPLNIPLPQPAVLPHANNQAVLSGIAPSLASPTQKRNVFTSHQPRSIPFARLMQRRLSAVPEENDRNHEGSLVNVVRRAPLGPGHSFRPYFANRTADVSARQAASLVTSAPCAIPKDIPDLSQDVEHLRLGVMSDVHSSGVQASGKPISYLRDAGNKENGVADTNSKAPKKKRKSKPKKPISDKNPVQHADGTVEHRQP
ncbi:hypothetical protein VKT23_000797 [Stygiomarasmius scandens]|uniref:Uncharacterized protein n=1 Tax=Marasmiellus scandens TaxID=2682957 RepID=A0ABR1K7R2_9AGAR